MSEQSTLDFMLNYWHGWWRFMWHWHETNKGFHLPDLKMMMAHRKYCDGSWDKIGFSVTLWRLTVSFNCQTIEASRAQYRKMFAEGTME